MNDEGQTEPEQVGTPSPGGEPASSAGGAAEISRRVGAILDAVEREAQRLRDDARAEATAYLENAQRLADDLVEERRRRIAAVSDELLAKSEAVVARLDDAAPVRHGFESLVRALGDAAERLAHDTGGAASTAEPSGPGDAPPAQPPPPAPAPSPGPPATYGAPPPEPPPPEPPDHTARPAGPSRSHPARSPSAPGWQAHRRPSEGAPEPPPAQGDPRVFATQMAAGGAKRSAVRVYLDRAFAVADATAILDEVFGAGTGEDARAPWAPGAR